MAGLQAFSFLLSIVIERYSSWMSVPALLDAVRMPFALFMRSGGTYFTGVFLAGVAGAWFLMLPRGCCATLGMVMMHCGSQKLPILMQKWLKLRSSSSLHVIAVVVSRGAKSKQTHPRSPAIPPTISAPPGMRSSPMWLTTCGSTCVAQRVWLCYQLPRNRFQGVTGRHSPRERPKSGFRRHIRQVQAVSGAPALPRFKVTSHASMWH